MFVRPTQVKVIMNALDSALVNLNSPFPTQVHAYQLFQLADFDVVQLENEQGAEG